MYVLMYVFNKNRPTSSSRPELKIEVAVVVVGRGYKYSLPQKEKHQLI